MLNGIKGKLNDDIMIVTGVTGGEIVSWFYPLLICSDFRYIIISIESLDGPSHVLYRDGAVRASAPDRNPLRPGGNRGRRRPCPLYADDRGRRIQPEGADYVSRQGRGGYGREGL